MTRRDPMRMSDAWLREQRQADRDEYHGPAIRWPIVRPQDVPLNLRVVRVRKVDATA